MLMLPFNFENGSDFRKGVQPSNQVEEQVVVAGPREGFALPGGAIHGGVHRRPAAGGKRQHPRAHVDAPPRGADALRAPHDLGGPQHEEDGDQDVRGQRRPVPRRQGRGGRRARVLRWGVEAIGCIPGDLGK